MAGRERQSQERRCWWWSDGGGGALGGGGGWLVLAVERLVELRVWADVRERCIDGCEKAQLPICVASDCDR